MGQQIFYFNFITLKICIQLIGVQNISMSLSQQKEVTSSFITETQPNIGLRILRKFDVFAFIPVPKDDTVSTKPSLIGTALFFTLFLTYVIIDLVQFVTNNPPLVQSYRTPLDDKYYTLPSFAMAFMQNNPNYNVTEFYDDFLTLSWNTKAKTLGNEYNVPIDIANVTYINEEKSNFTLLPWMSETTKKFYSILRTPAQPLKSKGLLFTSNLSVYPSIKFSLCSSSPTKVCKTKPQIDALTDFGRIFFFVEQTKEESVVSRDATDNNGNNYLQYNFFILQGFYKRVTINFQVVRTEVLPDYLTRWTVQKTQRLQIDSIQQQVSRVDSIVTTNTDAIAFNLQLSPDILNNRVAFSTLIDHVSKWGAFWGVLFAIFALFFLSYNRKKFYKKNPEWDRFKKVAGAIEDRE